MKQFRDKSPQRTCTKQYNDYRSYKESLVEDFNHRCGYTHCSDFWFGGPRTFHIDHFLPKSRYPQKECDYSNLVYACSYVNILKSNSEGPYLDPCNEDYNSHFERDDWGNIVPKTKQAEFMYLSLKLYLRRYGVIWMLDEIRIRLERLNDLRTAIPSNEINELIADLTCEMLKYMRYLGMEL